MQGHVPERRSVPRSPSTGRVEITHGDPVPTRIEAELVETSPNGFRASHDSKTLEPGLEVVCKLDGAEPVRARVIWTHVLGERRVSGFLLTPSIL
jgi:hypothetical protein